MAEMVMAERNVLNWRGTKAGLAQLGLAAAAIALPAACHLLNAPVRALLPMHWPVLLAGLVFGWRGGLAVGLLVPLSSFALSGMPPAGILPFMEIEIAVYGFAAGFARENMRMNGFFALLTAITAGRAALVGALWCAGGDTATAVAALAVGLPAAAAQLALLPVLAKKWSGK